MSIGALSNSAREAPGWYGKLATLGDFAHRRLPADLVQASDAWLARAMTASRQQLGDRWLDVYLTAPVMRFAWGPGVHGAAWWFGVLMPSCDNVGRYFPLLIAQARAQPPQDRIALNHLEAWFDHLAQAATHTLAERASIEAFEEALSQAPPWPTPGAARVLAAQAMPLGSAAANRCALGPAASLHHWLHALAVEELHTRFAGCSIWWHPGEVGREVGREASVTVIQGLPDSMAFAGMLSGG